MHPATPLIAIAALVTIGTGARASIVFEVADDFRFTRDAAQGLDFLDPLLLSPLGFGFDQVEQAVADGSINTFLGIGGPSIRFATINEVTTMLNNAGAMQLDPNFGPAPIPLLEPVGAPRPTQIFDIPSVSPEFQSALDALGLFGVQRPKVFFNSTEFSAPPGQEDFWHDAIRFVDFSSDASRRLFYQSRPYDSRSDEGFWLVRDVPSPGTFTAFATLALLRTRRRR